METVYSRACNKRICCTYIFTFSLLVLFFYHLMWNNRKSIIGLTRLQQDVNCISQALKVDCSTMKFDSLPSESGTCNPTMDLKGSISCESIELNNCVETVVKRKIGSLMDDVYSIKKRIEQSACKESLESAAEANKQEIYTPRINYASEELGARIISALANPIADTNLLKTLLGLEFSTNPPINMLRPSLMPGSCFGFRGSQATISLHLAKTIYVEQISLTHVPKEMTPSKCVNNAPKDFEVYGVTSNKKKELLGKWRFKNEPNERTENYIVNNNCPFRTLLFKFNSNHGANSTCIYRVEVFGQALGVI
ncbi:PREDICTED: SUN domain-containing protein 3 [Drosophila arizonae]|uniref:SUN domain-containing protein 3 n=1 Tax=Drosophila arizonae TaxID=7263 RepID=A0ABM1NP65_DROAR|nr:PREDICTED: SUN domain-containing protein 3 [Drosophila arizonae]